MVRGDAQYLFLDVIIPPGPVLFAQVLHDVVRQFDADEVVLVVGDTFLARRWRRSRWEGILHLVRVWQAGAVDSECPHLVCWLPVGVGGELRVILEPPVRLVILIVVTTPLPPRHWPRLQCWSYDNVELTLKLRYSHLHRRDSLH